MSLLLLTDLWPLPLGELGTPQPPSSSEGPLPPWWVVSSPLLIHLKGRWWEVETDSDVKLSVNRHFMEPKVYWLPVLSSPITSPSGSSSFSSFTVPTISANRACLVATKTLCKRNSGNSGKNPVVTWDGAIVHFTKDDTWNLRSQMTTWWCACMLQAF